MRVTLFALIILSVAGLSGCADEPEEESRSDHEYLPLRKGWFQIYNVEEVVYSSGVAETLNYQLRRVVTDSLVTSDGLVTYVIHQTRRQTEGDDWEPDQTMSARLSATEAVVTENGVPYVVLRFPPRAGLEWDGNIYNDEINPNTNTGVDLYTIESAGESFTVNGSIFNDCISVLQEDNEDFIVYHDERREVYIRGTGLAFREIIQLHYCNDEDRNCVGQQVVDEGRIFRQEISSYGFE